MTNHQSAVLSKLNLPKRKSATATATTNNSKKNRQRSVKSAESQTINEIPIESLVDREPIDLQCPFCGEVNETVVKHRSRCPMVMRVWFSMFLIIAGCFCGCCVLPFMVDGLKEAKHKCAHCNKYLASHWYL